MIIYQGKAHKLSQVTFHIPTHEGQDDFLKTWTFTSDDQRFEMSFEPVLDRHSHSKVLFLSSNQHQVFGYYSGKVILDDGEILLIERLFGFSEKVMNAW
jgi:hypothetical protein